MPAPPACGDVLDVLRSKRSEGIWFAPGQRVAAQERMERIDRALLRAVRRAERLADPIAELEEEQAVGIPVEPVRGMAGLGRGGGSASVRGRSGEAAGPDGALIRNRGPAPCGLGRYLNELRYE